MYIQDCSWYCRVLYIFIFCFWRLLGLHIYVRVYDIHYIQHIQSRVVAVDDIIPFGNPL